MLDGGIGAPLLGDGSETTALIGPIGGETCFSDATTLVVGREKDHPLNHDGPPDESLIAVVGRLREVLGADEEDEQDAASTGLMIVGNTTQAVESNFLNELPNNVPCILIPSKN